MHYYMRSIGFSKAADVTDKDMLLQDVLCHYDFKKVTEKPDGTLFVEISREYAPDCGITVCGLYDKNNLFHMDHYFPYFWGSQITTYEKVAVDRHTRTESFAGACDDMRLGTTMIFQVSNAAEYISMCKDRDIRDMHVSVSLSGLAETGSVLLPVSSSRRPAAIDPEKTERRNSLYAAAQEGDESALESLTMEDIDTYTMIARRVQTEDIYTIVNSYFMPFGMECDLYNIMGDITDCEKVTNRVTGEKLYQLGISCNDIPLDICINEKDLQGEPEPGRRLKATIWLQGRINF